MKLLYLHNCEMIQLSSSILLQTLISAAVPERPVCKIKKKINATQWYRESNRQALTNLREFRPISTLTIRALDRTPASFQ